MAKIKAKAALIWIISMILVLMMFPFPTYAASYGHVGYHCYKSNPSSGIVIIGDSNTCQLWNYQHVSASYCSTWGGHYGYGAKKGVQIDSPAYVEQMKKLITATVNPPRLIRFREYRRGFQTPHGRMPMPATLGRNGFLTTDTAQTQ